MPTTAPLPPPPLTRWQVVWRNLFAIGVGGVLWSAVAVAQWQASPWYCVVDLALGAITLVAMNFRRRWPLPVAMVGAVSGAASASSAGAGIITFVSLSTRRRWVEILPVAAVSVVASLVYHVTQPAQEDQGPWYLSVALAVAFSAVGIAVGMYIGARRELVASLHDRAERAEREQALRVAQARANERTRIAREMHDVLAHRMSLVAMHAGALSYRDNLTPAETREAADVIQANSHRALADLREILGVLRDADAESPHRPQPTLCDVDDLVADERAAGARITLSNALPHDAEVPQSIGRTAFRVIQESLTNARKHAPHTQVSVSISGAHGDGLSVEVRNPLRVGNSVDAPPVSGFGLIGLVERTTLARGRIEYGRTPERDFVVRAWLPWPA